MMRSAFVMAMMFLANTAYGESAYQCRTMVDWVPHEELLIDPTTQPQNFIEIGRDVGIGCLRFESDRAQLVCSITEGNRQRAVTVAEYGTPNLSVQAQVAGRLYGIHCLRK